MSAREEAIRKGLLTPRPSPSKEAIREAFVAVMRGPTPITKAEAVALLRTKNPLYNFLYGWLRDLS